MPDASSEKGYLLLSGLPFCKYARVKFFIIKVLAFFLEAFTNLNLRLVYETVTAPTQETILRTDLALRDVVLLSLGKG